MKHFSLSVHTLAPLTIRADHAAEGAKTLPYITGTTLLGSLAAAHRLLRPEQPDEFEAFFLREHVQFPHLYPALFAESKSDIKHGIHLPVYPLPKTAQQCKRFPGFCPLEGEDADEERHGIRDSLLDWAAFALLDTDRATSAALLAPFQKYCRHKECEQLMDHASGYYRSARSDIHQRMLAQHHTHLQTHTGINREWGTVEENVLYNREVFDQGTPFWGEVILPDELADTFKDFVREAANEGVVHMGSGRTRGMGSVQLELRDTSLEAPAEFKQRLLTFDTALRARASLTHLQAQSVDPQQPFYLAITLHSATILRDPFLRYYSTIDGALLETLLKPYLPADYPALPWCRIYQASGMQRVNGWQELWGTPKSIDCALEMGSTLLFSCSQTLDETLAQALQTLEEEGIGRRRAEGFGRIRISDPFHLQGEQA